MLVVRHLVCMTAECKMCGRNQNVQLIFTKLNRHIMDENLLC